MPRRATRSASTVPPEVAPAATAPGAAPTTQAEPIAPAEPTARGEQTKQLIVSTALRLFREVGYEQTTMRAVAREAGVSVGNAYYYFASKEHLIQAFYSETQDAHVRLTADLLASERDFGERLRGTMHVGIDALTPYHEFAGKFFKSAAEPTSPLHPLSKESTPSREASIGLFRAVLDGSDAKIDPELRDELPELLWLVYLGIVMFWVHDTSPEVAKTRLLIDKVIPMIDRLVGLSRLRILRPIARDLTELIAALKE